MGFPIVQTTYYYNNTLVGLIDAALAAPLLLAAAKLGLGVAVVTPAPTTAIADLSEATYTGYAESATVVWGTPVNESDGTLTSLSPSHLFRATSASPANIVNNFFVTDGVASPSQGILGSGRIIPAFTFGAIGDGFSLTVGWNLGVNSPNCEAVMTA